MHIIGVDYSLLGPWLGRRVTMAIANDPSFSLPVSSAWRITGGAKPGSRTPDEASSTSADASAAAGPSVTVMS